MFSENLNRKLLKIHKDFGLKCFQAFCGKTVAKAKCKNMICQYVRVKLMANNLKLKPR
jgi:hypothetical protein